MISSEPSNPYRAGVASLFTVEFYRAAAQRLRPGGIFLQWVQAYEVDGESISTIYATLAAAFPAVETWKTQAGDLAFLASASPLIYDVRAMRLRIQQEPYRTALACVWRVTDLDGVFARYIAHRDLASAIAARQPPLNTDDRNRLEFAFARTVGRKTGFDIDALSEISREQGCDPPDLAGGALDWSRVADRRVSAQVLDGQSNFEVADGDAEHEARTVAKTAFATGDAEGALQAWQAQAREPGDLLEVLLVAQSLAVAADAQALPYVEQLRAWLPVEAEAVQALYLWRQGRATEALDAAEQCFTTCRTNPWASRTVIPAVLEMAREAAKHLDDPAATARLEAALREPFCLKLWETERLLARLDVARLMDQTPGAHWTRDLVAEHEPHVPWTHEFLTVRAITYSQAGDSLAELAGRDLALFEAAEARPFIVGTPEEVAALREQRQAGRAVLPSWLEPVQARERRDESR